MGADADTISGGNRAAVVHVICAAPQFTDKGKVTLVVPSAVADCAGAALDKATKTLRQEAERRRKDARKAERAEQRARDEAARRQRQNEWTIKDAVFEVMLEAKEAAGHTVAARTLYYKVRPLVQEYTDKELDYQYFSQTLLPDYEREFAPLPGLYYEARGELHHPHDDTVTPLGTREVEEYELPPWQFDKILYVEKTGLEAQLAPYQLGQKYDMAIMYGKGYAVTACRNLLARSEYPRHEDIRPARCRHRRVQHRPHPRGGDRAHAGPQHRRHRPGPDGAAGHRARPGDREVHPQGRAARRPGTRRGRARMVHRRPIRAE